MRLDIPLPPDRESGQAMVEFALILFPLLLIVAGIIQFGIALNYWLDMQRIANQGARWAAVNCTRSATTPPSYNPCNPNLQTTLRQQALTNGLAAVSLRRDYVPVRHSTQGRPREGLAQDAVQTGSAARDRARSSSGPTRRCGWSGRRRPSRRRPRVHDPRSSRPRARSGRRHVRAADPGALRARRHRPRHRELVRPQAAPADAGGRSGARRRACVRRLRPRTVGGEPGDREDRARLRG